MTNKIEELEKGCGRKRYFNNAKCGDISNSKTHPASKGKIILCPKCKAELKGLKEGIEIGKQENAQEVLDCFREGEKQGRIMVLAEVEKLIDEHSIQLIEPLTGCWICYVKVSELKQKLKEIKT